MSVRDGTLWISFQYKGIQCRESLRIPDTEKNQIYAAGLLEKIRFESSIGTFNYAQHFPESRTLRKLGLETQAKRGETIATRLPQFMERHEKDRVSHTTYNGYLKSVIGTLVPQFGDILVNELRPSEIAAWVKLQSKHSTRKTVANHLIPLKNMYSEIEADTGKDNPVRKVNLGMYFTHKTRAKKAASAEDAHVDPFSLDEIGRIIAAAKPAHTALLQFAFFTGLRIGELIALRWDRINLEARTAKIDRNISLNQETNTKTGETRLITLLPQAVAALLIQRQFTAGKEFVFEDPAYRDRWKDDQAIRKKAWRPTLELAAVRYRKPYQARHSYATLMLMNGEDERWVAQQLGHANLEMLKKNYAKWLPNRNDPGAYRLRNDWENVVEIARFQHDKKNVCN